MGKKLNNAIYGGLTVATAGETVSAIGMAVKAFSKKKKVAGTLYTLAGAVSAGMNVCCIKGLIDTNKNKK